MSTNKRKTLQIKRPEPISPGGNRPLPKVSVNPSAAAPETDEIQPVAPAANKGATTRIQLPDEAKIRKARRADEVEDRLPGAEEIMQASKNATAQIMIDVEDVQTPQRSLRTDDSADSADKTMKISTGELDAVDAGSTSRIPLKDLSRLEEEATRVVTSELPKLGDEEAVSSERTMKIDLGALQTGDVGQALAAAGRELDQGADRTMRIDAQALQTGDLGQALAAADREDGDNADRTMKIDAAALEEEERSLQARARQMATETMVMDAADVNAAAEKFNAATMAMPPPSEENAPVTAEMMKDSFNAMTMAMDPAELAKALEKSGATQPEPEGLQELQGDDERPKTILIKRPSREAAPSGNPTVKTVRPDAQTVRTVRPAPSAEAPAAAAGEGKTVKLRRPGGATGSRPGAPVSRVAQQAGLDIQSDGSVTLTAPKKAPSLGGGWLAVSIVTFLVSCGALWITYSVKNASLPMMGRVVDMNNQFIQPGN